MVRYTTGEVAKLCDVTVRTVQYYDDCGLLSPSDLSEGGRRLYSESDVQRLQVICFFKELGFSLSNIKKILKEDSSKEVLSLLLEEQRQEQKALFEQAKQKLQRLEELQRGLDLDTTDWNLDHLPSLAGQKENRKKLRRLHLQMLLVGGVMDVVELFTLFLWIQKGIFWPFLLGLFFAVGMGIALSVLYFSNIAYLCPCCHTTFVPRFREAFFASHTPRTRRLTCPHCQKKESCIEIYREK